MGNILLRRHTLHYIIPIPCELTLFPWAIIHCALRSTIQNGFVVCYTLLQYESFISMIIVSTIPIYSKCIYWSMLYLDVSHKHWGDCCWPTFKEPLFQCKDLEGTPCIGQLFWEYALIHYVSYIDVLLILMVVPQCADRTWSVVRYSMLLPISDPDCHHNLRYS